MAEEQSTKRTFVFHLVFKSRPRRSRPAPVPIAVAAPTQSEEARADAIKILSQLGYKSSHAAAAVASVQAEDAGEIVRQVMQRVGKKSVVPR